ncbi:hypothetical protein V8E51_000988 [Hyaloscypha variabilis]
MATPNPSERVARNTSGDAAKQMEGPTFSSPNELVTIYVGPKKVPFAIHKEVACLYSPVLKAAFNSNFIEGQSQRYTLEEGTAKSFQLVVQWLYSQKIKPIFTEPELNVIPGKPNLILWISDDEGYEDKEDMHVRITDRLDHLVKVWITADYLQIPRLQNSVVDEIEQLRAGYNLIPVTALCQVYKRLPSQAALRKLIFEQCWRFCATAALAFANDQDIFPWEYLRDYIVADKLAKFSPLPDPFTDRAEFKKWFHVNEE